MKKIAVLIAIIGAGIMAISPAYAEHNKNHKKEAKTNEVVERNAKQNQCTKTALERHPGTIIEIKTETEDGKMIFDVDIQGKDGKTWEIECDAATGEVLEDKEKSDGKEKAKK